MRRAVASVILVGLLTVSLGAQGRGRDGERGQGVPPGHLPPAGECRVWYDDRPAGHQPSPRSCREAERIASRSRHARVIYGDRTARDDRWSERDDDRRDRDRPRAIPRRDPSPYPGPSTYPDRYPNPGVRYPYPDRDPTRRGASGYASVPFDNGYEDGYEKGREDARDDDEYDPVRHSRYRSGDRGYDRREWSKEEYRNVYREGFRAGYDDGYRAANGDRIDARQRGIRLPWPF